MSTSQWDQFFLALGTASSVLAAAWVVYMAQYAPAYARAFRLYSAAFCLFALGNVTSAFHWFAAWPLGYAIIELSGCGVMFWAWRASKRVERQMAARRAGARPSME